MPENIPEFIPDSMINADDAQAGQIAQTAAIKTLEAQEPKPPKIGDDAPPTFISDNEIVPDEFNPTMNIVGLGEAFGRGAIPGFTAIERAMGVGAEGIAARQKAIGEPTDTAANVLGFVAPAILSGGASALGKAGIIAPEAVAAAKAASKSQIFQSNFLNAIGEGATIGMKSEVAKQALATALETSIFVAGDEAHKMLTSDEPDVARTAIQGAIAHMGFGFLAGGALGTVTGLWAARNGAKLAEQLKNVSQESGTSAENFFEMASKDMGPEKQKKLLDGLRKLKENAAEIEAAGARQGFPVTDGMTSADKMVQDIDSSLTNSASPFGAQRQQTYSQGFDTAKKVVSDVLKTDLPEEISKGRAGEGVYDALNEKITNLKGPVDDLYNLIKQSTETVDVDPKSIKRVANNLLNQDVVKITQSSPAAQFVRKIANDLQNVTNVDQLRTVMNSLNHYVGENPTLGHFAADIRERLTNLETSSIEKAGENLLVPGYQAKEAVKDLLGKIKDAKEYYAPFKGDLNVLAKGLGLGKIQGPQDFLYKLSKLKPEQLIDRLFANKDSRFINFFADRFGPELKVALDYQKKQLFEQAMKSGDLRFNTVFEALNKMSPEVRAQMFTPKQLADLNDIKLLVQSIPKNINPSGTTKAAVFNEFWKNPLAAVGITIGDSAKLAFLKFLKSTNPISATGFKAATDYIGHAASGMTTTQKAAKDLLRGVEIVVPSKLIDRNTTLKNLDRRVQQLQNKPEHQYIMAGEVGHYLPSHSTAIGETLSNVVNYLGSQRPFNTKSNFLDTEMPPAPEKENAYYRTLEIANSPLMVLKRAQNGTLTSKDVIDLNRMYPDLHNYMRSQLTNSVMDHLSKKEKISFQIKKSLSMLMGQPLESTFTPQAIMSAQSTFVPAQQAPAGAPQKIKHSTSSLTKLHHAYQTPIEARLTDHRMS